MNAKLESLRRAVQFGLNNGKKNMIVNLPELAELFNQQTRLLNHAREFREALKVWVLSPADQGGAPDAYKFQCAVTITAGEIRRLESLIADCETTELSS